MINVAILGFGTVGSGVAEVLESNNEHISKKISADIRLKYILDLRDFPGSPFADRVVHDFSVIEADPEVNVVVETIGGAGIALEYTRRALSAGKSVVTSNKELVATHGYELLQLAGENNVNYLFEASVGGGIPIVRPINQCLAANELTEITGILNGTTNYILTRMIRGSVSFDAALKEAQVRGYAERDPSDDIHGKDACRKICILAALAFGRHIYPEQVPTQGITDITISDVLFARSGNMKIKLLGRAVRREDNRICAHVAPYLVPEESPLANVEDVFNAISVKGDAVGEVMFYGRGAGKLPTASAVVADVMDAAKHLHARKYLAWQDGGEDAVYSLDEVASRWYLRVAKDAPIPADAVMLYNPHDEGCVAYLTGDVLTRQELFALVPQATIVNYYRVLI